MKCLNSADPNGNANGVKAKATLKKTAKGTKAKVKETAEGTGAK